MDSHKFISVYKLTSQPSAQVSEPSAQVNKKVYGASYRLFEGCLAKIKVLKDFYRNKSFKSFTREAASIKQLKDPGMP